MTDDFNQDSHLAIFKGKKIRRTIFNKEWYFSVVDVVEALTDSPTPRQYWGKIKQREFIELQLSPIWVQLKLESSDGKKYETDCANTEGIFRIIQSIPSPKAEPFKRWLARVGYERVQEIENPELASNARTIYFARHCGRFLLANQECCSERCLSEPQRRRRQMEVHLAKGDKGGSSLKPIDPNHRVTIYFIEKYSGHVLADVLEDGWVNAIVRGHVVKHDVTVLFCCQVF